MRNIYKICVTYFYIGKVINLYFKMFGPNCQNCMCKSPKVILMENREMFLPNSLFVSLDDLSLTNRINIILQHDGYLVHYYQTV